MIKDYLQFEEPITSIYISETITKGVHKIEHLIVNDKWKIVVTGNVKKPFRKEKIHASPQ